MIPDLGSVFSFHIHCFHSTSFGWGRRSKALQAQDFVLGLSSTISDSGVPNSIGLPYEGPSDLGVILKALHEGISEGHDSDLVQALEADFGPTSKTDCGDPLAESLSLAEDTNILEHHLLNDTDVDASTFVSHKLSIPGRRCMCINSWNRKKSLEFAGSLESLEFAY
ncbi:hypothetical protein Dimus_016486 [Dionaea muscipula]